MTIWIDPTGNGVSSDCNGLIGCISELVALVEQRWDARFRRLFSRIASAGERLEELTHGKEI